MPKKRNKRWFLRGFLCGIALLLLLFYGGIAYMRYEADSLTVSRYEAISETWTLPPLRIAVAADFHVGNTPEALERLAKIVDAINAEKPDLILLPGDFAAGLFPSQAGDPRRIAEVLSRLKAPLGVYAVLGNHDHWQKAERFTRAFEEVKLPLLENRSVVLEFAGKPFRLAGVIDGWTQEEPPWAELLPEESIPRIVMTHGPDIFETLPESTALAVAGHTHGGQIVLPFLGSVYIPSRHGRRYASGLITEGKNTIFVTTGTGTSNVPLRLNCPPEIAILTLKGVAPIVPEPTVRLAEPTP